MGYPETLATRYCPPVRLRLRWQQGLARVAFACAAVAGVGAAAEDRPATFRSPLAVAFSPDGKTLAATDHTAGSLALLDPHQAVVTQTVKLQGQPTGLAWSQDGKRVFVAEFGAGAVAEIDAASASVIRRLPVGRDPMGVALAESRSLLLSSDSTMHSVCVVDLRNGERVKQIPTVREPFAIAVTSDESRAVVSNLLPAGRATDPTFASAITLIDLDDLTALGEIRLPPGSSSARDVIVSPDNRWAYALHTLGRTNLPSTHLERGWINTNALSIIDLSTSSLYATLLLDQPAEGAPNPWCASLTPDGNAIWISISGAHWLAKIDLEKLHRYLDGGIEDDHPLVQAASPTAGGESIWVRIKRSPEQRRELVNDLAALHSAGLIERIDLPVTGPRGVAVSPDGELIAAAGYFSANIALVDRGGARLRTVSLGESPEPDLARRGEMIFHDARYCFQRWLSCSTCHPREGRVDGLNWDLPNDGVGNPKNVKSLLWAHQTPPTTWHGVRDSMTVSVEKGFFFQMFQPRPGDLQAVNTYLQSLQPRVSPHRDSAGDLTEAALRGQQLFEADAGCASCHTGPLLTDLELHDVGAQGPYDRSELFDTPSLVELYATAPYLHDGSAATLQELIARNVDDQHGATSGLTPSQIEDLIAYLLSL